jgi:hypothetical protein
MNTVIDKICGCEINNPDPELFDVSVLEPQRTPDERLALEERLASYACMETWCSCPAECIEPENRCLVPKGSQLHKLGHEVSEGGVSITYFASGKNGKTAFFRLSEPANCWATITYVEEDNVPHWALSALES